MAESYNTAVAQLLELGHELHQTPSYKFDLAHMRVLLEVLEHPERRFPAVLIAGTNGKGSTAATLASILRAAGHRTGLYTSPHLLRVNERIQLDGEDISDPEFTEVHARVEECAQRLVAEGRLPWHPSFFETLTAMAFEYFASARVEIAVLEVGMGGRLDATNVVDPVVAVITDIALDHQKFLGDTITEIAREKAGIIRPGGVVVTLPQHPEANDVLGNTMLERGARAVSAVEYVPPVSPGAENLANTALKGDGFSRPTQASKDGAALAAEKASDKRPATSDYRNRYSLTVLGREILVDSPLPGRHQLRNLALAIAAAVELKHFGFNITADAIERGIRETRWPGRFQIVREGHGFSRAVKTKEEAAALASEGAREYILDVAHNPAGAWALRSTLSAYAGEHPLTFVFGAMRDKAIGEIADILFPLAAHVVATRAENPRSATPAEIRSAARWAEDVREAATVAEALELARTLTPPDGLIVVTGSIYVVGEALAALR